MLGCEVINGQCKNVNEHFNPRCFDATIANFPAGNAAGTAYNVHLANKKHLAQFGPIWDINAGGLAVETLAHNHHVYEDIYDPFTIKIGCSDLGGYLLDFSFCYFATANTDPPHMFFSSIGLDFHSITHDDCCEEIISGNPLKTEICATIAHLNEYRAEHNSPPVE